MPKRLCKRNEILLEIGRIGIAAKSYLHPFPPIRLFAFAGMPFPKTLGAKALYSILSVCQTGTSAGSAGVSTVAAMDIRLLFRIACLQHVVDLEHAGEFAPGLVGIASAVMHKDMHQQMVLDEGGSENQHQYHQDAGGRDIRAAHHADRNPGSGSKTRQGKKRQQSYAKQFRHHPTTLPFFRLLPRAAYFAGAIS
jgi:hypothetical protein